MAMATNPHSQKTLYTAEELILLKIEELGGVTVRTLISCFRDLYPEGTIRVRVRGLHKERGFVDKDADGIYTITPAGERALAACEAEPIV